MNEKFVSRIASELTEIETAGLSKKERIISSEQGAEIIVNGKTVLNFCANNYLGLSSHPKVLAAAKKYIDLRGYGMSSVRFICGTQDIHKELEKKLAGFLGTEDTILYAAAFDANGGVFDFQIAIRQVIRACPLDGSVDSRQTAEARHTFDAWHVGGTDTEEAA